MFRLLRAAPSLGRASGQRVMATSGSTPAPPNIKELAKMAQLSVTDAEVRCVGAHARRIRRGAARSARLATLLRAAPSRPMTLARHRATQVADWEPKINGIVDW